MTPKEPTLEPPDEDDERRRENRYRPHDEDEDQMGWGPLEDSDAVPYLP